MNDYEGLKGALAGLPDALACRWELQCRRPQETSWDKRPGEVRLQCWDPYNESGEPSVEVACTVPVGKGGPVHCRTAAGARALAVLRDADLPAGAAACWAAERARELDAALASAGQGALERGALLGF